MERSRKQELVAELKQQFAEAKLVVVAKHDGLGMSEINTLRDNIREAGASMKVTKNSLAKRALEGSEYDYLKDHFTGPTAVAFSNDEISAAKVFYQFSNENDKLSLLAGGMEAKPLSAADVTALASLPSLDELRGKLVGLLQAPATKVAGTLQAPAGQLARVFGAYGAQS